MFQAERFACHESNQPCGKPTQVSKPSRSLKSSRLFGNGASQRFLPLLVDVYPLGIACGGARLLLLSRRDEKTHAFFSHARLCVYFVCNVYLFMSF
jgi:hypothetical protein